MGDKSQAFTAETPPTLNIMKTIISGTARALQSRRTAATLVFVQVGIWAFAMLEPFRLWWNLRVESVCLCWASLCWNGFAYVGICEVGRSDLGGLFDVGIVLPLLGLVMLNLF